MICKLTIRKLTIKSSGPALPYLEPSVYFWYIQSDEINRTNPKEKTDPILRKNQNQSERKAEPIQKKKPIQ